MVDKIGSSAQEQAYADEFRELLESTFNYLPPQRGEIRSSVILQIDRREVIVDLGAKRDGIVPVSDLDRLEPTFRDSLKVGAQIPVYVMNPRDPEDNLIVSINMGLQQYDWEKARELITSEEVVEVGVKGHNRGGILVSWNRLEGFIPSSHLVTTGPSGGRDTWDELVNTSLMVKVIEVDQTRRRLIFSEREAQREWRAQQKARLLAELKEGDKVRGTVTGLRDFGAFVNLGGADGLIHVSELAWHRVDHPRDVLKVGDNIEVYVLSLDKETNRIALSRKRLLPDPWDVAQSRYHEGQMVEGIVTNVVDFGAFVALDDGLEGLLHLSEMGDGSLKEPYSYVKKGDRLSLRISHLEPEKRRVGFTQRWGADGAPTPETAVVSEAAPDAGESTDVEGVPASDELSDLAPVAAVDAAAMNGAVESEAVSDVNDAVETSDVSSELSEPTDVVEIDPPAEPVTADNSI